MRTTSNKKSPTTRLSSTRRKARLAVQRVDQSVTRHRPKPRVGFENLVEPVARLIAKYGDVFGPGIDEELMRSSLSAYQSLQNDYEEAVNQFAKVENTRLVHVVADPPRVQPRSVARAYERRHQGRHQAHRAVHEGGPA